MEASLRILLIAYPLLPVTESSAGGAEQVLWTVERELAARGHSTTVAAAPGSSVSGALFEVAGPTGAADDFATAAQEQITGIVDWLKGGAARDFDLIQDMSGLFWQRAAEIDLPVLVTLHLARSLYPAETFKSIPKNVRFNLVSDAQRTQWSDFPRELAVVRNGIALDRFRPATTPPMKREYLLWLGRICEEKGPHVALDVAHEAGEPIIVAGKVYPFLYHQKFFAREVLPRMRRAGTAAKFIDSPSFEEKLSLLRGANAVLITSLIDETSSLVAMEAAACGTPVLALRRGALPEVVAEGVTGFLRNDPHELAVAVRDLSEFDPAHIRAYAEQHFNAAQMADGYEGLYRRILRESQRGKEAAST